MRRLYWEPKSRMAIVSREAGGSWLASVAVAVVAGWAIMYSAPDVPPAHRGAHTPIRRRGQGEPRLAHMVTLSATDPVSGKQTSANQRHTSCGGNGPSYIPQGRACSIAWRRQCRILGH